MSDDLARVQERVYALKLPEMEALAVWLSQVLEVRRTLDALRPPGADREASASAASSRGRSRTPSRAGKSGSLAEEAAEGLVPRPPPQAPRPAGLGVGASWCRRRRRRRMIENCGPVCGKWAWVVRIGLPCRFPAQCEYGCHLLLTLGCSVEVGENERRVHI